MTKFFTACAIFGAVLACVYRGVLPVPIFLSCLAFFSFVGICITYDRHRKRILKNHDPNTPFTSAELRQIGIIPPENYDDWLDKYARR